MIKDFSDEFERYKILGNKALSQISDDMLNRIIGADNNSAAIIVRHISGNLVSRFTDFLDSDGEKDWRDRDSEFENQDYTRQEVEQLWARGWGVLESQMAKLNDSDLQKQVRIRGQALTVNQALARSVAHIAYHVGQIVLLARILADGNWQWLSIPKGESKKYNLAPNMEKKPL